MKYFFLLLITLTSPLTWGQAAIEPDNSTYLLIKYELPALDCSHPATNTKVGFSISREGKVFDIGTVSAHDDQFSQAAEEALSMWLFKPRVKSGYSVSTTGLFISFRCRKNVVTYEFSS